LLTLLVVYTGGGNAVFVGVSRASFSLTTVRGSFGLFSVGKQTVYSSFGPSSPAGRSLTLPSCDGAKGGGTLTCTGTNMASVSIVRAEFGTGTWSLGGGAMNLVAIQSYSAHVSAVSQKQKHLLLAYRCRC
jgi:hypothetical protein